MDSCRCKLTAAAMVASVFFLVLLSPPCGAKHKECGELHSPLPLCDGNDGGDACIARCINEGYATGKCFGGDNGCMCLRPCSGSHPTNGDRPAAAGGSMKAGASGSSDAMNAMEMGKF